MHIPLYFAKALLSHCKRMAEHGTADRSDTKTVNAFRLARKELRRLERMINETDQCKTEQTSSGNTCSIAQCPASSAASAAAT